MTAALHAAGSAARADISFSLYVGYADQLRPNPFFPTPWASDANVFYAGGTGDIDAGAIRILNTGSTPITVNDVTIVIPPSPDGGATFHIWDAFLPQVLLPGQNFIATQTVQYDFDTSDVHAIAGADPFHPAAAGVYDPVVALTIDGVTSSFFDTAHILDTGGFDGAGNPLTGGNESHEWQLIGTPSPSVYASWDGSDASWSNAAHWSSSPNSPNNGTPAGTSYRAVIGSGTIALDVSPTIESLLLMGGAVTSGGGTLKFDGSLTGTPATIAAYNGGDNVLSVPVVLQSSTWYLGSGNVQLTGPLTGNRPLTVAGDGVLTLENTAGYAGAVNVRSGTLRLNSALSAAAPVTLDGGSLSVDDLDSYVSALQFTSGNLFVGGNFAIGAGHTLLPQPIGVDKTLTVPGILSLESGVTTLSGGSVTTGKLTNTGGSMVFTAGDLHITDSAGGSLFLTSGAPLGATLDVQTGMSMSVADTLTIAADGSLSVSGGSLSVAHLINSVGAPPVSFTAGSLEVGSDLAIGTGHTLAVADLTAASNLRIGGVAAFDPGADITLSGGVATFGAVASAGGHLHLLSGNLGVGGGLDIGAAAAVGAAVDVPAGLNIGINGATHLLPGSSLSISGGSLKTAAIVNDSAAPVSFTAGALQITEDLTIDTFAPDRPLGNSVALHGSSLSVGGNLTVGDTSSGSIVIDSAGGLSSTSQVSIAARPGATGSIHVGAGIDSTGYAGFNALYIGQRPDPAAPGGPALPGGVGSLSVGAGGQVNAYNVYNRAGSSILVDGGALFCGAVVNDGLLSVQGGGTFATYGLSTTGAFNVGDGASITIYQSATFGGVQSWPVGYVLNTPFATTLLTDAGATGPKLSIVQQSGFITFASTQHLVSLELWPGATATMTSGGHKVLVCGALSIISEPPTVPFAVMDITDNAMILDGAQTPLNIVSAWVKSGYNAGSWNGNGINSSLAAVTPHRAVGYALASSLGVTSFVGESVAPSSVLIRYTLTGDSDLDGDADGVDIGRWAVNFTGELGGAASATKVWSQGDWDYDGDVDGVDAGLWAQAFTGELGGAGLVVQIDAPLSRQAAEVLAGLGITVVPEPIALTPLLVAPALGIKRCRRRMPVE